MVARWSWPNKVKDLFVGFLMWHMETNGIGLLVYHVNIKEVGILSGYIKKKYA